jgi:carbonic anhydrase
MITIVIPASTRRSTGVSPPEPGGPRPDRHRLENRGVDNALPDDTSGAWPPAASFDDLLAANRRYTDGFGLAGLKAPARRGLAVVTCMDSRIEPLTMLGLVPGDAKIMRNAGARITDDALRSLILATNLLDVRRIAVVQHTDCAMTKASDDDLRAAVGRSAGASAAGWEFLAIPDQEATLRADVQRVRECPLVGAGVVVGGFVYDVHTGALRAVV